MMKERVNLHLTVTLGNEVVYLDCWTWHRPNTTIKCINGAMERKMSFICPQDVKDPRGIFFQFWTELTSQMLFSLRHPTVKVHGKTVICMDTD